MKVTIHPSLLSGTIQSNASKSSMQRACAAALLCNGTTIIKNPGHSNDDKAALDIIQKLGATVIEENGDLKIKSEGVRSVSDEVNCGESGLSIRMFTPIVALSNKTVRINGSGSLLTRPMDVFDEVLPQLGVTIKSNQGKLPLEIKGPLLPRDIEIDGSLSSQFLTGMLMAFGSKAENITIQVRDLKSKPYIDLTLNVMKAFGVDVENKNYEAFFFKRDGAGYKETTYTVEGDWSGAAFLLVAGAIAGNIVVKGLDVFSTQADRKILEALMDCGCNLSVSTEKIEVSNPPLGVRGFHFNATECPDLFPPLVALASYCNGKSVIEGISRLTHKESNRAITLQEEFAKLGVEIDLQDDLMIVHGGGKLKSGTVHSRHDHRIAMACAVAALKAEGAVTIEEAEAINKSYPDFYEHLKIIGANVSL